MHKKGGWMLSYRFKQINMNDNRSGTDDLSDAEVLATPNRFGMPANLRVIPEDMTGQMHMIGGMVAPTDWLTLMLMAKYIDKEMTATTYNMAGTSTLGKSTMKSSGWGDTSLSGLVRLYDDGKHHVHLNAGVSLPTGSIKEKDTMLMPSGMRRAMRLGYGMQLGSGTFDLMPGLTYYGHDGDWGWGAQVKSILRLGENSQNYSFGNKHVATAWGSYSWVPSLSTSLRVTAETQGDIDGIDSQITGASPTADPDNYGGERISTSLGMNYLVQTGALKGHRFSMEATLPVYQNLNGIQMKRESALVIGWQKAF